MRAARDAEDTALALVNARTAALDRTRARRDETLAERNADVAQAETELADAIDSLVHAAGLDRAALVLGMPVATLRKALPPSKPNTAARMTPKPAGEPPSIASAGER